MNKPKHTPGPWILENDCIRTYAESVNDELYLDLPKNPADARLIAAAPEMLEALKALATNCSCTIRERDSGHRADCAVPQANQAIAKAEGRDHE